MNTISSRTSTDPTIGVRLDRVLDRIQAVARHLSIPMVRLSLALVMLWFGIPKLFPGGSPAEDIAVRTVEVLVGGLFQDSAARLAIGVLEVGLGVALAVGRCMPMVLLVVLGHMAGTFAPLVLFPTETWHGPGVGTLEGQYIIKNVVLVAGVVVLAGWGMRGRTGQARRGSAGGTVEESSAVGDDRELRPVRHFELLEDA